VNRPVIVAVLLLLPLRVWSAPREQSGPVSVPVIPAPVVPQSLDLASRLTPGLGLPTAPGLTNPGAVGSLGEQAKSQGAQVAPPAAFLAAPQAQARPETESAADPLGLPGSALAPAAAAHGPEGERAAPARRTEAASLLVSPRTDGAKLFDGAAEHPIGAFAEQETLAQPSGLWHSIKSGWKRWGLASLDNTLKPLFNDESRKHYYHGLSIGTLEKAVDSGGLAAGLTFVSDEAGHPYGYARTSARRTGTPGVVLQFDQAAIEPLIKPGHFNPRAPAPGEKWEEVPHWYQAEKPIPLSAQTELSKKTVLNWLAEQRDAHPEDASWDARVAKFEAAFGAKAPAAKPKAAAEIDRSPAGRLGLSGVALKAGRWYKGTLPLKRIARGTIGFVDVHPTRPGLILKTIDPVLDQFLNGLSVKEAIDADDKAASVLAAAGVGPKVLGTMMLDNRHVSVRERILGRTMQSLVDDKAFGPQEEALVLDMARRMAKAKVLVSDMKPENIMIGTTERDGTRKAWFIDGGIVEEFAPGMDEEARYNRILDYPNVIMMRLDYNTRSIQETVRPLRFFIQDGREDSSMSRWRLFLKKFWAAFLMGGMSAANK
jgi:hypothetical protein